MKSIKSNEIAERDEAVRLFKELNNEQQIQILELTRSLLAQQDARRDAITA